MSTTPTTRQSKKPIPAPGKHNNRASSSSAHQTPNSKRANAPKSFQNLFVAHIPRSMTNLDLISIFEPYGATSATVMMDAEAGTSKGFGFAVFDTDEQGKAAIEALHNVEQTYKDLTFTLQLSPSKHDKAEVLDESQYVYFRNVPGVLQFDTIRSVFGHYGQVVSMQNRPSDSDKEFNLVMVEFGSVEDAKNAIKHCHGDVLFPQMSQTPVMAKFASPGAIRAYVTAQQTHSRRPPPITKPIAIKRTPSDAESFYGMSTEGHTTTSAYGTPYHSAAPTPRGSEPSSYPYQAPSTPYGSMGSPGHSFNYGDSCQGNDQYGSSLNRAPSVGSLPVAIPHPDHDDQYGSSINYPGDDVCEPASTGTSLNEIGIGQHYRHEPYCRNGYIVTPVN